MSRTCKKFLTMVNKLSRFRNYEAHMKQVFIMKTDHLFFADFRSRFKIFFLNHFSGYANYLHMKWFLSILYEQLNERVLFAHVYFCRRNSNDPFSCEYWRAVPQCKIFDNDEYKTIAHYSLITYGRWDENFVRIFQNEDFYSSDINRMYKACPSRDFIWCYNQLLNYFAKISVRIFLNIGKNHLLFSRFKQKFFYDGYVENSRNLFKSIVDNLSKSYLKAAVARLVPIRDYDPMYLVICNIPYVKYKQKKKNEDAGIYCSIIQ